MGSNCSVCNANLHLCNEYRCLKCSHYKDGSKRDRCHNSFYCKNHIFKCVLCPKSCWVANSFCEGHLEKCGKCGEHICQNHGVRCNTCKQVFCTIEEGNMKNCSLCPSNKPYHCAKHLRNCTKCGNSGLCPVHCPFCPDCPSNECAYCPQHSFSCGKHRYTRPAEGNGHFICEKHALRCCKGDHSDFFCKSALNKCEICEMDGQAELVCEKHIKSFLKECLDCNKLRCFKHLKLLKHGLGNSNFYFCDDCIKKKSTEYNQNIGYCRHWANKEPDEHNAVKCTLCPNYFRFCEACTLKCIACGAIYCKDYHGNEIMGSDKEPLCKKCNGKNKNQI